MQFQKDNKPAKRAADFDACRTLARSTGFLPIPGGLGPRLYAPRVLCTLEPEPSILQYPLPALDNFSLSGRNDYSPHSKTSVLN